MLALEDVWCSWASACWATLAAVRKLVYHSNTMHPRQYLGLHVFLCRPHKCFKKMGFPDVSSLALSASPARYGIWSKVSN